MIIINLIIIKIIKIILIENYFLIRKIQWEATQTVIIMRISKFL